MSQLPPHGPLAPGPIGSNGSPAAQPAQPAPYGAPQGWAPPPAWGPPPGWGVTWGWPPRRSSGFNWSRLPATMLIALIIAAVVLGGIGVDSAIAAPSAGTVVVGGPVTLTAASGWVEVPSDDASFTGVELRKANAILTAEVEASDYIGDSASLLQSQKASIDGEVAQASYGDAQTTSINGHDTNSMVFEATVTSGGQSGVIDGELVCMVVDGNAVVILVAAGQGHLDPVIDDVTAMLDSVSVGR